MGYPRPVMLRSQRSTIAPTLLLLLAAHCGGPSGSAVKTPAGGDAKKDDSIADLAASQGGLASLGGGRNGEVGTGTEAAMSGPLRAEQVIKGSPVKLDGRWGYVASARAVSDLVESEVVDIVPEPVGLS